MDPIIIQLFAAIAALIFAILFFSLRGSKAKKIFNALYKRNDKIEGQVFKVVYASEKHINKSVPLLPYCLGSTEN